MLQEKLKTEFDKITASTPEEYEQKLLSWIEDNFIPKASFPLDECCEALGWQGGTIHQVKDKIKEMVEENKCLPFAREAFIDIYNVDKLDDIKYQIEIIIRELENILHIPPDSRFSA